MFVGCSGESVANSPGAGPDSDGGVESSVEGGTDANSEAAVEAASDSTVETGNDGGDFMDDAGVCRGSFDPASPGPCPLTYDEALVWDRCGMVCAGPCGDFLIYLDSCTPSYGCAYDPTTRKAVGFVYGDDIPAHCDNQSHEVVHGDWPSACTFDPLEVDKNCYATGTGL